MRNLIIRFNKEGEYFREIDEDRHYYLSEAEEIIKKIRSRLEKEKRTSDPKPFECWIDGQPVVITHVTFEKKESIEKQLEKTILHFKDWEDEIRHKYINKLKEYANQERQLFLNREFKDFAIRFDQVLGNPNMEPFPFVLDVQKLKHLFDAVYVHITNGFYSELERIMIAIETTFKTIIDLIIKESLENMKRKEVEENTKIWLANDENFRKFIQHVSACYQSVSKSRIEARCSHFQPFQELETFLFQEFAAKESFKKAYDFHVEMMEAFHQKFDDILFKGFALKDEKSVESLVLNPVIKDCWNHIHEKTYCGEKESCHANKEITVS